MITTQLTHDSEAKAKGQQVFTACAFIHHNFDGVEKVFLPKRSPNKKFMPNVYELPGGHIDYGEDMAEGLKREAQEELGKDILLGDPFAVFTYLNEVKESHSIEVVYFAQFAGGIDDIQLTGNHSEYRWVAEDEIDALPNREPGDEEVLAVKKGFALLRGKPLRV